MLVELKDEYLKAHGDEKARYRAAVLKEETAIVNELRANRGMGIIDWRIQFAEVMGRNAGLDVVLANPPYVNMVEMDKTAPQYRDQLRNQFLTTSGGFDLFIPFMERGISLTRGRGMFAYIVPNKLLSAEYASALRRHFLNEMCLRSITDLSHVPVFSAAVYPVIAIGQHFPQIFDSSTVGVFSTVGDSADLIEITKVGDSPIRHIQSASGLWSPPIQAAKGDDL